MIGENKTCAREGCDNPFQAMTHNQKFCCGECTRIHTNAKIMEKYHERSAIRKGKKRWCDTCKVTMLSRYNETKSCDSCRIKKRDEHTIDARVIASSVIWL